MIKTVGTPFLSLLISAVKRIPEPLPDETVAVWAEKNITLPPGQGADDNLHPNWELTPDIPFVLEMIKNPDVQEICMAFSSQSTKTLSGLIMVAWLVVHIPMDTLWVVPDNKLLDRISKRIRKLYETSNLGIRPERAAKRKNFLQFYSMMLYIGIASSSKDLSSDPMGVVVVDEEDENPEFSGKDGSSPVKLAAERQRTFRNRKKLIRMCTPRRTDRGIWPAYQKTRQYKLYVPCPKCKKDQILDFQNIKWPKAPDGHAIDPDLIKSDSLAWYECKFCVFRIFDDQRIDFLAKMKWKCETPKKSYLKVGFHKSALYSPFTTWSGLAYDFLDVKDSISELRNFQNSTLAEPKERTKKDLSDKDLKNELCGDYYAGTFPAGVQAFTIGVDVQEDHLWFTVLGWGYNAELWYIYSGRVVGNDLKDALPKLLPYQFKYELRGKMVRYDMSKVRYAGGAIDCRWRPELCYDFCRRNPQFTPVMGGDRRIFREWIRRPADPDNKYRKASKGLMYYQIDRDQFQNSFQERLIRGGGSGGDYFHLPMDVPQQYLDHLGNEVRKPIYSTVKNTVTENWVPRTSGAPQHLRDSTIYGIFKGHMLGLNRIRKRLVLTEEQKKQREEILSKSNIKPLPGSDNPKPL